MAGLTELVAYVANNAGISQERAKVAVKQTLAGIDQMCAAGDPVVIKGFGKFYSKTIPEHTARNPSNGAEVHVREKQRLKFKQSSCR